MNTSSKSAAFTNGAAPWSAVIAIAMGAFALVTSEFLPVGLLPLIARELHISAGQAGLMVTMPGILAAMAALLSATAINRIDRRHVLICLLCLLALSNALVAMATNTAVLLAGRALIGAAIGSFWAIGISIGPRLRPGKEGIRAASIILSGVSLGTVAGVPAGALLGHLLGWRWAFGGATLMALIVLVPIVIWLPSVKSEANQGFQELTSLFEIRTLRIGLLATAAMFIVQFGTYTYIAPLLNQVAHIDEKTVSGVLLGYGAAGFLGNLLGGWGAAKNARMTAVMTAAVIGVSVLLLSHAGGEKTSTITCVLAWGLGFGMMPIAFQSWLFESAPERLDSIGALLVATAQVAIAAGSWLGGLGVDHLGVTMTMTMGAAAAIVTAVWITQTSRVRCTQDENACQPPAPVQ
jgi:predicted MFS family arabinose efflux permease